MHRVGLLDEERKSLTETQKERKGLNAERDKYKDLCKEAGIKPNPAFLKALGKKVLDLTVSQLLVSNTTNYCHGRICISAE